MIKWTWLNRKNLLNDWHACSASSSWWDNSILPGTLFFFNERPIWDYENSGLLRNPQMAGVGWHFTPGLSPWLKWGTEKTLGASHFECLLRDFISHHTRRERKGLQTTRSASNFYSVGLLSGHWQHCRWQLLLVSRLSSVLVWGTTCGIITVLRARGTRSKIFPAFFGCPASWQMWLLGSPSGTGKSE